MSVVLDAYKSFSPELYEIAKDFFDNAWIDVPPRDGKRSRGLFARRSAPEPILTCCLILPANATTC